METTRIFVKGLPPTITEAEFRKHFSAKNREITDVKLIPQRRIGYVGYKTPQDASGAVKYFNKSYIRMSKISVEPAKPISDPALNKSQRSVHSGQPVASNTQRPHQDDEGSSKKRKREDLDESDPKLREFLRVMKTGKEGVLADETNPDADMTGLATGGDVLVPEGESDDEYEQIPKKKEKLRKLESSETSRSLVTNQRPSKETSDQGALPVAEGVVADDVKPQEAEKPPPLDAAATDDDWLRSRTNRLLDLVDPEDLPRPTEPAVEAETVVRDDEDDGDAPPSPRDATEEDAPEEADGKGAEGPGADDAVATITRTSRLFVRNLPYTTTEEDLHQEFGKFGTLQEVHLPTNASGVGKGFALVLFDNSSDAVNAFQALDGVTFQGRILHIIPAEAKKQNLDEFGMSKLPLKKQNMIRKKAEAATSVFNWNSLYMSQDAVNASVAARLGVSKSEVLDPTSADAAVKQAIAETTVIQETKAYFASNGVDLDAFKSHKRGGTSILVKNFPYGTTMEELRKMFEECGPVLRVLMPPAGTIAIVQFAQLNHAKAAFGKMAYRRVKDSVLFLEKAPVDLFKQDAAQDQARPLVEQRTGVQKLSVDELLASGDKADEPAETASLFVRNLNFATTTNRLAEIFEPLDGFVSARVKTKIDPKRPGQTLSMGFGFVEFRSKEQAQAALKAMDGYVLDGHALGVKASHRGHDAAEERRREDAAKKAAATRTKIVIKNLPFQATKKDIRTLFGTYGQLRSVRVPKKADYTARGFAFADFVTPREAENALNALKDTHLLGRRLVLDFAAAEAVDAEEEIEKMQRKVGGQANKMALQQLTGGGRKKVTIGNDEDELEA
ncbi:RNA-binding domain-containing protein [Trichoderma citrinoviride]|uniref:Multiple RNA-binding domain-containing protein 1 n=1 Tax=Trichoderma citrinoviride TaxID=58853 RepID=A0A2T4BGB5_9HYPO|nr:RNA-binding domain-containing protein [Trichoderma citrinoviride]PTB68311.1 RNA-binding domain-containing protein [Trichoderma citrinoviride]